MIEGYPTAEEAKAYVENILLHKALYPAEVVVYLFKRVAWRLKEEDGNLRTLQIRDLSAWVEERFPVEFMIVNQALDELSKEKKIIGMIQDGRLSIRRRLE
tara:strand:+ start:78 stop:380 length:303 start_codon:yes stop_codon:yes gene_type:complete